MTRKPFTPLNPAFADISTAELITQIENECVFTVAELEAELDARLERIGIRWRFASTTKFELYFPAKTRKEQRYGGGCNTGLFDTDARR